MKRYCLKCHKEKIEYFDILRENDDEFFIRLTRASEGSEKVSEEIIPRHLFQMCLNTGYFFEMPNIIAEVA